MGSGSESGGEWWPRGVNQVGSGGGVGGICEWGGWIFGTARVVLWYILVLCTKVYQFGTVCYVWYNVPKRTKAYQKCTNVPNLVFGTAGEGGVSYGLIHF